jgi:hypothetical protein
MPKYTIHCEVCNDAPAIGWCYMVHKCAHVEKRHWVCDDCHPYRKVHPRAAKRKDGHHPRLHLSDATYETTTRKDGGKTVEVMTL